jgi:hypothetical protein
MLRTLIRLWREGCVKTDCRTDISGSLRIPDSSIEEMLLKMFFYQRKRWALLHPRAPSRQPRKGQGRESVVDISCPSGSVKSISRVEHFESIGGCIIFAKYLKRSLAHSCAGIGLPRWFEKVIVPGEKTIIVPGDDDHLKVDDKLSKGSPRPLSA